MDPMFTSILAWDFRCCFMGWFGRCLGVRDGEKGVCKVPEKPKGTSRVSPFV